MTDDNGSDRDPIRALQDDVAALRGKLQSMLLSAEMLATAHEKRLARLEIAVNANELELKARVTALEAELQEVRRVLDVFETAEEDDDGDAN